MAPLKKSKFLRAVVDKGRRLFGNRSTQSLPGDLHSATNPQTQALSSSSTTSQRIFRKSNDSRHDMSVLAMTYILQDNPTIRELILLIIGLDHHDDPGKVCAACDAWSSSLAKDGILSSLRSLRFLSRSQFDSYPSPRKIHLKHYLLSKPF